MPADINSMTLRIGCKSTAQALAAARAVFECRVLARLDQPGDDKLHALEMSLYRLAEQLKRPKKKPRRK